MRVGHLSLVSTLSLSLGPLAAQCAEVVSLGGVTGGANITVFEAAFGQDLYFAADTAVGRELWKWSPTSGAELVADVQPGIFGSNPQDAVAVCTANGPRVFFTAFDSGNDRELWATDGTGEGTYRVSDVRPGPNSSQLSDLTPCGDRVFFLADDAVTGQEIWVSDGTEAGTTLTLDLVSGLASARPRLLTALDDRIVFVADLASTGYEPWVSDGTPSGTMLLRDIRPGTFSSVPTLLTRHGDHVYFFAESGTFAVELWRTDGTTAGTELVIDLATQSVRNPGQMVSCGGKLYFVADILTSPDKLFVSDGTAEGTKWVPVSFEAGTLTCSGDRVFCPGDEFFSGEELWVSDGTRLGTHEVLDLVPGFASSAIQNMIAVGSGVCFQADVPPFGKELWFSDGTPQGTYLVCDLHPTSSGGPAQLRSLLGHLAFVGWSPPVGIAMHVIGDAGAQLDFLGFAGPPGFPRLEVEAARPPVFAATLDVRAVGPSSGAGVLLAGNAAPPQPLPTSLSAGGCVWVDLATALPVAFAAGGSTEVSVFVPVSAVLTGVTFRVQAVWVDPVATPPVQLSNALQWVVGNSGPPR